MKVETKTVEIPVKYVWLAIAIILLLAAIKTGEYREQNRRMRLETEAAQALVEMQEAERQEYVKRSLEAAEKDNKQ